MWERLQDVERETEQTVLNGDEENEQGSAGLASPREHLPILSEKYQDRRNVLKKIEVLMEQEKSSDAFNEHVEVKQEAEVEAERPSAWQVLSGTGTNWVHVEGEAPRPMGTVKPLLMASQKKNEKALSKIASEYKGKNRPPSYINTDWTSRVGPI